MKKIVFMLSAFSTLTFGQTNLLDASTWTAGTGSVGSFNAYQNDASENERISGSDALGGTSIIWKAIPSGNGGQDGGWRGTFINIDHTKTYRFTVWMKKTISHDGYELFGFEAHDGSAQDTSLNLDGSADGSPWFNEADLPALDTWYLMVGFAHGSNETTTTHLGAIYATDGTVARSLLDYKFAATTVTMREEAVLWGNDTGNGELYLWNPTLYEVNGQEPTVQDLLGLSGGSDTQAPTAPTLSSIGQTDSTADLSWTGATDNTAVTGYKIYKDGVLEATLGNVSTHQVTGLTAGTSYNFTATALDAAGNESPVSNAVSVTTNSSGGGGGTIWNEANSVASYTGNVAVGTGTVPNGYQMAIDGKLITEEVKVQLSGDWPDYVFAQFYDLPTLEEVEQHINEKGHLINMPSASEVEANGIELGEMNKLLLEKIEELTLYILQQEQDQKRLHKNLEALQKEVSQMRTKDKS
ncbi:fibronectin type III domain-containing protein [Ulvibacterium sp.]|uniref:fibronectin type III domain-containing protein n=1 Tax=Ulvibacterium sp. TaxID=2665914 RepID=UPI00260D2233|nr:fibronectin type III domain-containing protein [Ulvibacterium sp.]